MGAAVARARVGVVVVAGGRHVGNHSVQLREGAGRSLPLLVRRLVARVAVADAVVLLDQIAHAEHQFGVERFGVCGDPAGHDLHDRLVACLFGVALQVGKQDDGPRIGIGEGGFAEFLLCLCRHEECSNSAASSSRARKTLLNMVLSVCSGFRQGFRPHDRRGGYATLCISMSLE